MFLAFETAKHRYGKSKQLKVHALWAWTIRACFREWSLGGTRMLISIEWFRLFLLTMKKNIVILILLTTSLVMFGQEGQTMKYQDLDIEIIDNEVELSKVINVESLTKEDLYFKSLEILNRLYKSSKSTIQTQDKERGIIIGKGIFTSNPKIKKSLVNLTYNLESTHIIKVMSKDGKVKISISVGSVDFLNNLGSKIQTIPLTKMPPFVYECAWDGCPISKKKKNEHDVFSKFVYEESILIFKTFKKALLESGESDW